MSVITDPSERADIAYDIPWSEPIIWRDVMGPSVERQNRIRLAAARSGFIVREVLVGVIGQMFNIDGVESTQVTTLELTNFATRQADIEFDRMEQVGLAVARPAWHVHVTEVGNVAVLARIPTITRSKAPLDETAKAAFESRREAYINDTSTGFRMFELGDRQWMTGVPAQQKVRTRLGEHTQHFYHDIEPILWSHGSTDSDSELQNRGE